MNVDYTWVEIDAQGNPVAEVERTEGLSATDVARPGFTAPALTAERVLRYRLAVQGRGYGNTDAHTASDTVTVTVRAAPAVTAVALTSLPQNPTSQTYRAGETDRGERDLLGAGDGDRPAGDDADDRARGGDGDAARRRIAQSAARRCCCSPTRSPQTTRTTTGSRCRQTASCSRAGPLRGPTGRPCSATMRWRRTRRIWSTARRRR